ncbi:MAG: FHA domain-containing protein [Pseudomonadota bacterium]
MPIRPKTLDSKRTIGGTKQPLPPELGALLEFTDGDEAGRHVALTFERTILGRKYGDILVRDVTVSGTHLALEFRRGGFRVVDLGSSNGTFVEGERVGERAVKPGEEIRLGDCAFQIVLDPALAAQLRSEQPASVGNLKSGLTDLLEREFIQATAGETLILGGKSDSSEIRKIRLAISGGPDRGKEFEFTKSTIWIGRLNSDLVLADPDVSRKHAALERGEGGQVILRDLASANGTFVNDRRISNCILAPRDRIRVGQTTIVFKGFEKG